MANENGHWITTKTGAHIFIEDNKSSSDSAKSTKPEKTKATTEKYIPQTSVEKKVDKYIKENWESFDDDTDLGSLAYRLSASIRAPYPVLLDAVSKSVDSRTKEEKSEIGDVEKMFGVKLKEKNVQK